MARLIIHQPKNFESRYYRYYNIVFDTLIDEIKKTNDVLENSYFKYANVRSSPTLLLNDDTFYDTTNVSLFECEMLIENYDTQGIKVLSVSDIAFTCATNNLQNNPNCNKILMSQYNDRHIDDHVSDKNNIIKYSPWVYFPQTIQNVDWYWKRRNERKVFADKMYFRGTTDNRKILAYLSSDYFYGGCGIGGFDMYVEELLNFKVGLSVAGRGEYCYRDIEYMAMGIPFVRFKYTNKMSPDLIPNFHYISVDRPSDMISDNDCTPEHARLLEERFLQVKDDKDFLKYIAKNAREYYDKYITINNCVAHTLKLLELDKW